MAGPNEAVKTTGALRHIYDVCMTWISGPYGIWVLFCIALVESSFFPIPPDVFLIAMCVSRSEQAFRYAAVCSVGSVIGGGLGYGLGFWFMDSVGNAIIDWYGMADTFARVKEYFHQYDVWIVGTAGFTPIPYKLFTITAGVVHSNFPVFLLISLLSRSARFFLVAALIWKFGPQIQRFIDRYFNLLSLLFVILLAGGFLLFKFFV